MGSFQISRAQSAMFVAMNTSLPVAKENQDKGQKSSAAKAGRLKYTLLAPGGIPAASIKGW